MTIEAVAVLFKSQHCGTGEHAAPGLQIVAGTERKLRRDIRAILVPVDAQTGKGLFDRTGVEQQIALTGWHRYSVREVRADCSTPDNRHARSTTSCASVGWRWWGHTADIGIEESQLAVRTALNMQADCLVAGCGW